MTSRERIFAALDYRPVDKVPLRISAAAGGLHEHGQKLLDLFHGCGHDFGSLAEATLPDPLPATDFEPDGTYHAFRTDAWGTRWEYRIPGIWGHPVAWPVTDLDAVEEYAMPSSPAPLDGDALASARRTVKAHQRRSFRLDGLGSLFEKLHSIRRFEDVLVDLALDDPRLNRLADRVLEHMLANAERAIAVGSDAAIAGDDFGTATALMMSPETWRRFFKPRYERVFAPLRQAGVRVFFHICGHLEPILPDFRDLGVNAIWPQLTLWVPADLHARCRDLGLAIEIHPDRGDLMQRGTPDQVREYVLRAVEDLHTLDGGSWLYIEIDPGFPWPNVEALFNVATELRA
ncbi:MAG: hypothetical protein HN742_12370 [Lentisphaerae bacterium]|jgi:hypothetical protein|nr:hypothetical protein [Lentisphaerota bacterium]MBT5607211.1 hypothetical protein [Lentisphaerota bacterium]MBT7054457.1 hypothetical protein [Lentisphaerota bacterium]MBT7842663.1 hypothetical protein [Lentisphaerota bacterium]